METLVVPGILLGLLAIPLGIEVIGGGHHNNDDTGDVETTTSTDPSVIVDRGAEGDYVVMSDDNDDNNTNRTTLNDDVIFGGMGMDTLTGSEGNDVIDGGSGDDAIDGGIGSDILIGGNVFDTTFTNAQLIDFKTSLAPTGPSGFDSITDLGIFDSAHYADVDTSGADTIHAGDGRDTVIFGQSDVLYGGGGADTFVAATSQLNSDHLAVIKDMTDRDGLVLTYKDVVDGQPVDAPEVTVTTDANGTATVFVDGKGVITVENAPAGFSAADVELQGYAEKDVTSLGNPLEIVNAGTADVHAIMSENNIWLNNYYGTKGSDILFGGKGKDDFDGASGDDLLVGGSGEDHLFGGSGNDILITNELFSKNISNYDLKEALENLSSGDDLLHLSIFSDNNVLNTTSDDTSNDDKPDRASGGEGDDLLIFGPGDAVRGGEGADTYLGLVDQLSAQGDGASIAGFRPNDHLILAYKTDEPPAVTIETPRENTVQVLLDGKVVVTMFDPIGFTAEDVELKPYATPITSLAPGYTVSSPT